MCSQSATGCESNDGNGLPQAGCHLRPRSHKGGKPFGEDLSHAVSGVAKERADVEDQLHVLTSTGQVFDRTTVSTMQMRCWLTTYRTGTTA